MTIDELAAVFEISAEDVREYQRSGLLQKPNDQNYTDTHQLRMGVIVKANELGMAADEIRSIIDYFQAKRTQH